MLTWRFCPPRHLAGAGRCGDRHRHRVRPPRGRARAELPPRGGANWRRASWRHHASGRHASGAPRVRGAHGALPRAALLPWGGRGGLARAGDPRHRHKHNGGEPRRGDRPAARPPGV
eukprot:7160834-Pyramimonas_sp.AAC.3